MRTPIAVLEAEDLLEAARAKAAAAPENAELQLQVGMAARNLEVVRELAAPRAIPQDAYDAAKNTIDVGERLIERAYNGGAE